MVAVQCEGLPTPCKMENFYIFLQIQYYFLQVLLAHESTIGDHRSIDRSMSVFCTETSGSQIRQIVIIATFDKLVNNLDGNNFQISGLLNI